MSYHQFKSAFASFLRALAVIGIVAACVTVLPGEARPQDRPQLVQPQAGMTGVFSGWCMDEEAARRLATLVIEKNDDGYVEAVMTNGLRCYDVRLLEGLAKVQATLVEHKFTIVRADGSEWAFWTAADGRGSEAYVWFLISIPEGLAPQEEPGERI
jgi:hypothetical protein